MVTTTIRARTAELQREQSLWSSLNILSISCIMLIIAVIWRVVDQFVLGLGETWMNIMPSKLFPLLIILGFFWRYRKHEIGPVLGLASRQIKAQLAMGVIIGLLISVLIDIGGAIVYSLTIDSTYPLQLHVLRGDLLGYLLLFFLTNALLEETLFRGLLQNSFKSRMASSRAILLSALMFGFWHAGWPLVNRSTGTSVLVEVVSMVFFTTVLGLLFGIYYDRFSSGQSLLGLIIAHTIFNFISECIRIGPEPVIQGPDLVFSTPGLMMMTLLMFFVTFVFLFVSFWRFRIEKVSSAWQRMIIRIKRVDATLQRMDEDQALV